MSTAFLPLGSNPQSASFTCNSCGIKFVSADLQRQHMKTEWHRYNLKRRVANLPAIPSDVFAHKVLQQQKMVEMQDEVDEFGFVIRTKKDKQMAQQNKMSRELLKRGRLQDVALDDAVNNARDSSPASVVSELSQFSLGDALSNSGEQESNADTGSEYMNDRVSDYDDLGLTTDGEATDDERRSYADTDLESLDEYVDIMPITYCFYCGKNNYELESNIKHMSNNHGLYIPERSYLVDLEGLLTFLMEVIYLDHECLVCGFEGKNLESIRQHMITKSHCRIPYETPEEQDMISEFYDFEVDETTGKRPSTKKVSFNDTNDNPEQQRQAKLPNGTAIIHRSSYKNPPHPPRTLIRKSDQDNRAIALSDRRMAPGLTAKTLTKQERQTTLKESKARMKFERIKDRRTNFHNHFTDQVFGKMF